MTVRNLIRSNVSLVASSLLRDVVLTILDDINLVDGMPVGLQVVGGRFGEETCVKVAKAIEQAFRWKDSARPSL